MVRYKEQRDGSYLLACDMRLDLEEAHELGRMWMAKWTDGSYEVVEMILGTDKAMATRKEGE